MLSTLTPFVKVAGGAANTGPGRVDDHLGAVTAVLLLDRHGRDHQSLSGGRGTRPRQRTSSGRFLRCGTGKDIGAEPGIGDGHQESLRVGLA
jgi:hypothetical protein